jgi:hypothetical protein
MTEFLGYSHIELIAGCILIVFATASLISTVLTIWLIIDMKKWNGYLKIICTLTVCQLLFDIQFIFVPFYKNEVCNRITAFLNILGGLSVSLWTNVISFLLYRIVQNLQSVNIEDYYLYFLVGIGIISLVYAIIENIYRYDHNVNTADIIYDIFRALSVAFNFVVHGLISVKLRRMGFHMTNSTGTTPVSSPRASPIGNPVMEPSKDPVRVLSSRIKYYPIVQVVTLSGAFWYVFQYSFNTQSYNKSPMPLAQQVSLVFYAITLPSAGLGYFAIFLLFQPQAYNHFRKRLGEAYQWCCCYRNKTGNDVIRRTPRQLSSAMTTGDTVTTSRTSGTLTALEGFTSDRNESLLGTDGGRGSGGGGGGYMDDLDEDELVKEMVSKYALSGSGGGTESSNSSKQFDFQT